MDSPLTLLLVDDDHNDRSLFGLAADAEDLDLAVQTVGDGQSAREYLEGTGIYADRAMHPIPDLVVTDLHLPALDGLELLSWLRTYPSVLHLPVVVFTASADPTAIWTALESEGDSYVAKPSRYEDWKAAVREIYTFGLHMRQTGGA